MPAPTAYGKYRLVNIFTIALTHLLMLVAAWRLLFRDDLDRDPPASEDQGGGDYNSVAE